MCVEAPKNSNVLQSHVTHGIERLSIYKKKIQINQYIFFFFLIFCYGVIQYNPNITRKPKNRERERILFKAESSVGSEAEIIGYGVKPKI